MKRVAILFATAALAGCSSVEEDPPPPIEVPPVGFVADAAPGSPSIALELRAVSDQALMLDIVGRGIGNLYGLSFRIETDGAVLMLETLESSTAWDAFPTTLVRSIEPRAGLGLGVITAQGEQPGIGAHEETLGTLHFGRLTPGESPVRFVTGRAEVIDDRGLPTPDVEWIGGTLR